MESRTKHGAGEGKISEQDDVKADVQVTVKRSNSMQSVGGTSAGDPVHLTPRLSASLKDYHKKTSYEVREKAHDHDGHDHHHKSKPRSLVTAIISSIINFLLMFGLCCAYGMIMFNDDWHLQHRTLGVKMNLATACFAGLFLAIGSGVQVAIGGPDLNPVVFLAGFVSTIGQDIAGQLGLEYPAEDASAKDAAFCVEQHLLDNVEACAEYHEQLRATIIFATTVSSAILGVCFFCIGKFHLTKLVRYLPTSIMEAFLSCVGYKVFKYALKFCKFDIFQFVPAAAIGILIYFMKAQHIGNPAVVIPVLLCVPLLVFYSILYGVGSDIESARANKLMFPEMHDVAFWTVWTDGLLNFGKVNIQAWMQTLPELVIMIIVCVLDCLLKLSGMETKLPIKVDQDYEVQLSGLANLWTVVCGSSVGYQQLKFNVINFGIMGNTTDRRGGIFYAVLCGLCFFGTVEQFNYQPRFFLSMLLFFAGAGFVAENLWGSRHFLTQREWIQIILILGVFIFTEKLLYAVIVGGLLTGIDFIMSYSRVSCVLGAPLQGGELSTHERHDPLLQLHVNHVSTEWLLLVRLKGYVFFGSAQPLIKFVREKIEQQHELPEYRRLKYIIFDCKLLDGMDVSAAKSIKKIKTEARAFGVRMLWTQADSIFIQGLKQRHIMTADEEHFSDIREALGHVEKRAIKYLREMRIKWSRVHPGFALYQQMRDAKSNFEPFQDILPLDAMRHCCPWVYCDRVVLEEHKTLLWEPGQDVGFLFLVHSGAVALHDTLPDDDNGEWPVAVAVYRHGWFLNRDMLTNSKSRHYAIAAENGEMIRWSEEQWYAMSCQQPYMASAILKAIMKQQKIDWELSAKDADKLNDFGAAVKSTASMALEEAAEVPETLQSIHDRLYVTQSLDQLDLFMAPDHSDHNEEKGEMDASIPKENNMAITESKNRLFQPEVPNPFTLSMDVAFQTYSSTEIGGDILAAASVGDALLFAGIPSAVMLDCKADSASIRRDEFMSLGKKTLMAGFNKQQVAAITKVFEEFDGESSGKFDGQQLRFLLRQVFQPRMSIEEIDAMARFWDYDGTGTIDKKKFCNITSRFVREHEPDWILLNAMRALLGQSDLDVTAQSARLTVESLTRNSHIPLSEKEAEEMLWTAGWRSHEEGDPPAIIDVVAALLVEAEPQKSMLPPVAIQNAAEKPTPATLDSVSGALRTQDTPTMTEPALTVPSFLTSHVNQVCAEPPTAARESFSRGVTPISPKSNNSKKGKQSFSRGVTPLSPKSNKGTATEPRQPKAPINFDRQNSPFSPPVVKKSATRQTSPESDKKKESVGASIASRAVDLRYDSVRSEMLTAAKEKALLDCAVSECPSESDNEVETQQSSSSSRAEDAPLSVEEPAVDKRAWWKNFNHLLHEPEGSWLARAWSALILGTVIISLVALFFEPLIQHLPKYDYQVVMFPLEIYFTVIFSVELTLRYVVSRMAGAHTTKSFITNTRNICDFIAITPFFFEIILKTQEDEMKLLRMNRLTRLTRLVRILRITRIARLGAMNAVMGAVCTVFAVIWGIYLKNYEMGK